MKKKLFHKALALSLAAAMTFSVAACGDGSEDSVSAGQGTQEESQQGSAESSQSSTESGQSSAEASGGETGGMGIGNGEDKSADKVRLTMYPADANLSSGVVAGYKADVFAKHGIELEVWAYSDEKTNAILVSGDLPDIMYVSKDNLDTMIDQGMLLCLDDYLDEMPHLQAYADMEAALNFVREYRSAGTGKVYGLPLWIPQSVTP